MAFLFSNDLFFLLPEIFWVFFLTCLLLFGVSLLAARIHAILITKLGNLFLFAIILFLYLSLESPTYDYTLLNYQYNVNFTIFLLKIFFLCILFIIVYASLPYFYYERLYFSEYFFFVGLLSISAFFLISASDFIVFYLAIELQALIVYSLAAIKRYNLISAEAGLKYFLLGALSSGLLLLGISLFYGLFGLTNFYDLKYVLLNSCGLELTNAANLAIALIISALFFKLSAAPFHVWVADVYEGSPTPIVLLLATLPKLTIFVFFIKFYILFLYEFHTFVYIVILFVGMFSVLLGTLLALKQFNIKRFYAYSAIVNIGYLLVSVSDGTLSGFTSAVNYFIVYVLSTCCIFFVLLMFRRIDSAKKLKILDDYLLLFYYNSYAGFLSALVFFSIAGTPPLAGFFTKFLLLKTIFLSNFMVNGFFFFLIIFSVISAYYYIRVARIIFFSGNSRITVFFVGLDPLLVFFLNVLSLFLGIFMFFQPLVMLVITVAIRGFFL